MISFSRIMRVVRWRVRRLRRLTLRRQPPRAAADLLFVLLVVLLLSFAARLVFLPDPQDQMRRADTLFQTGSYHAALLHYQELAETTPGPDVALRLGMVRTVRGEHLQAERALRQALGLGVQGHSREITVLYLGHILNARGEHVQALRVWDWLPPESSLQSVVKTLRAELALYAGDYATAEASYRAALDPTLPADWRELVAYRLGLLRAATDPTAALGELRLATAPPATLRSPAAPPDPRLTPLLPRTAPDRERFLAVLHTSADERPQLLGQFYLDLNLFALAEAQFTQVDADHPHAQAAAAYAAYTRWRAGDTEGGLQRLEDLVATYPDESRARTLLALVYLARDDTAAAQSQIDTIAAMAPAAPDTHLAWANWYVAQRDYVQASAAYQRALEQTTPDQRGTYALLVAQFHLNTTYELCQRGLPTAETAAQALPDSATAWTTLAASRYHCGNFAGAAEAAQHALAANPDADAAFYLGAALAALGQSEAAQHALVHAADLAPASVWRERAEARLALLR